MKRWAIICIGTILLMAGAARQFHKIASGIDEEIQSYVHNLNYSFTARVDSVISLKKGGGYLICEVTSGQFNKSTEDSLNAHLTSFNLNWIRFLHFKQDGQFLIITGQPRKFKPKDSVVVNSNEDKFYVFRKEEIILKTKISTSTRHKFSFAFWIKG